MGGIQALIEASKALPLDFFFMAPSCVPATPLETAGAIPSSREIQKLLEQERVLGLGEMMNFPGILATHRLFHEFLPRAEPSHNGPWKPIKNPLRKRKGGFSTCNPKPGT
jgi:adenine deaminase